MTAENYTSIAGTAPLAPATRRIRVLHIIHSVTHGGIESALINWVTNFDRDQFDVYVGYFANDRNREEPFLRAAKIAGIDVIPIPWAITKPFIRAARAVAKIVRERKIDIIHTHAYYGDALGALTKMFVRVKVVATVYIWGKYELHRQIMQVIDWVALHFVDRVTAHCDRTRRWTIKLGFPANKVSTLIVGFPVQNRPQFDPADRLALRRSQGIRDDEILLVNVARIHPEKAHDQMLQAFRTIHDRHPNTRLWISGVGWEWLEEKLKTMRRELDLEDSVDFVGFRQDLWPMLFAADMMIHTSHVEGVPVAILYGMTAGLPIVVSDVGSLYEVIETGKTGVLVPENDIQGFAAEVIRLIEDPARARQIGAAAQRFVEDEYSIRKAVRDVERTYREVLAE